MKRILTAIVILLATLNANAQNYGNSLPATDALGRKLIVSEEAGEWEECGEAEFRVKGRCMEVAIPRRSLGLDRKDKIAIEFKWTDNIQSEGDIYDFYISGDAAPLGRFNYVYLSE